MSEMLIDYYKAIETSSQQMLTAAKTADWAQVARYEGVCAILIEQLRGLASTQQLEPAAKVEKTRIMQRILQNDAEIRYLAEPMVVQEALMEVLGDHVLEVVEVVDFQEIRIDHRVVKINKCFIETQFFLFFCSKI